MLELGAWLSASLWNECVEKIASLKTFLSQERAPARDKVINFSCFVRSKRSSQRWNNSSVCSWLCNITRAHCVNMFTYEIKHQKEKKETLRDMSARVKMMECKQRQVFRGRIPPGMLDAAWSVGNLCFFLSNHSTHLSRVRPCHLHSGVPGCSDSAVNCQAVSLQQLDETWGA